MPACPTLVITGERSWMRYEPDPASHQIGQIDVVTVPGGHSILWDAFDEAADAIVRFLNTGSK
jgi:pimeloyl-ACP methyl ester carboxylesterase